MSNEEVNKMLSMLESNELEKLKQYLLKEQYINNNIDRQRIFEDYIINSKQINNFSRICINNGIQKFTNGRSIYILNTNLLITETLKLQKNEKKFKFVEPQIFDLYIDQISSLTNFDTSFVPVNDLYITNKTKHAIAKFNTYNNELGSEIFEASEITTSKIILCDPEYKISTTASILKAESSVGKVYIFSSKSKL